MANKRPEFQVYNSMTKQKEIFKPIVEGKVGMYVCGVTSYDLSHIGHARAYVAFDVLYRYLRYLGYEIIRRANEVGEDPKALSWRFCQEFLNDMADLQCLLPTQQPRVTDHMEQIKDMIAQIISNGCGYAVDGDVYFSVDNFPKYGLLSGRKLEDNRAGERVAVDDRKRNPADFALWKAAKPGEPVWDSPWGPGRPGWHIECSAMSAHYLTHTFDIHGGGMDLIFPHHENEIAQSCAACSESRINYWIHNGFVTANDEKMSKSLGNFFTIREVTKLYHPLALRHFLLGTHYRSPVNYSISQIEISSEAVFYIYQKKQQQLSTVKSLVDLEKHVREVLDVLGLLPSLSYTEVLQQLKDKALRRAGLTEAEIFHAIEERTRARKNKEFSRSDQIRSDLAAKGIALMDVGKETVWRPCVPVQQEQPSVPAQQEKPGVPGEQQNPPRPAEKPQSVVPADKQQ
ncbi:UNVERIFIED_CONTAM: Cysteine--tRNA ligase CPS1, chloroplastic/mitochondrial [Sesamum calycinum]|uniref:cysteine--tRNA ligase n=1 Tax=Sesamum calycinum TaxID=2727403 RepID=A0AAW2MNJ1_9LAMI